MIDMGLGAMREYTNWLRAHYGAALSIDMEWQTMKSYPCCFSVATGQDGSVVGMRIFIADQCHSRFAATMNQR